MAISTTQQGKVLEHIKRKQFDAAANLAQEAIKQDPALAWPHSVLGACYAGQNRYEDAINSYLRAIELDPAMDRAYVGLCGVYMQSKKYDEAEQCFVRAKELNLNNSDAYWNGAGNYLAQGKNALALQTAMEGHRRVKSFRLAALVIYVFLCKNSFSWFVVSVSLALTGLFLSLRYDIGIVLYSLFLLMKVFQDAVYFYVTRSRKDLLCSLAKLALAIALMIVFQTGQFGAS